MLETFITAGLVLAAAIAAVIAYASTRPDTFRVQRSASIRAPAEAIFPLIASLRQMNTWNPFIAPDPKIEITYSGPDSGRGAAHTWSGNRNVGEGRIEITDATAPSRVVMQLDMLKPMAAHNTVEFSLRPAGDATAVTWAMSAPQTLMSKIMSLFIDGEAMCGREFEKGLASLKAIAENAPVR